MALTIDLSGRVALVTGATGQLGRVMVRTLAEAGADVAIHYKQDQTRAEALADEVRGGGRRAMVVAADVHQYDQVIAMRDAIRAALGDAHIVVTNAVSQVDPWHPVLEEDLWKYEDQFRSCTMQNVHVAKAFIPAMVARKSGRLIAINTECAMQMTPQQSAYAAAKRGMDGVLRCLAREVGEHQVTVNEVAPGWTISDRARETGTERQPE